MLGRIQARGAGGERPPGAPSAAVSIRLRASEENLAVVAAVATGAAEALDLDLEPTIRLRTISLEAAGNVVAHAYPDGDLGPLELLITPEPGDNDGDRGQRRIHVSVVDEGIGCGLPPSSADPPGLGLPMICSLSEAFTLRRGIEGGTEFDATIVPDAEPDASFVRTPPPIPDSCSLTFGDSSFLEPVLTRALAAQTGDEDLALELLDDTLRLAGAIADGLSPLNDPARLPSLLISRDPDARRVSVWIGPLFGKIKERLALRITAVAKSMPGVMITTDRGEIGGEFALITMPLTQV